jgi:hypothetical protein
MRKNMQKWVSNIVLLLSILLTQSLLAQTQTTLLSRADSLYGKKKYAEAQQMYFELFQEGFSTPATLLKMAFVYEGLGDMPKALFFLTQYYNKTEDAKAYDKILVLSNARNLKGYELSDLDRVLIWIGNRSNIIIITLLALALTSVGLMIVSSVKHLSNIKVAFGVLAIFLFCLTIVIANFGMPANKGVISRKAYIMKGPSPGANFITMVDGGNQVPILDSKDVWVKVNWNDKVGYIKRSDLLLN